MAIATFEILALYRARREGYTTNVSRLVSHALIVALVLTMVGLSLVRWNLYVEGQERVSPDRVSPDRVSPDRVEVSLGGAAREASTRRSAGC